jgi:hypothetical protein
MSMLDAARYEATPNGVARDRALRIVAKSIYKELRSNGFEAKEIVALSSELLSLVTDEIRLDTSPLDAGVGSEEPAPL